MPLRFALDPELTVDLREQIISLWTDVTNAGGAVGFVAPVTRDEVRATAAATFAAVAEGTDRLLVGHHDGRLVAMLVFAHNRFPLKEHYRVLKRVMVHPDCQGRGYGTALLREAERLARRFGLDALHLTVRGGLGLEGFYERCGYKEVGRLPGALRVAPGDDRDEILMWLSLT